MIGRDERAISGAAAAEHGQGEHVRLVADAVPFHKSEMARRRKFDSAFIFPGAASLGEAP